MLPPEAIDEFKDIYEREFGIVLQPDEAQKRATEVFVFMKTIFKPNDLDDEKNVNVKEVN